MVTVEANVMNSCMLESEAVSAMWVESMKTKNKFADGLLRTLIIR